MIKKFTIFILMLFLYPIPYTLYPALAQETCSSDDQCSDDVYYTDSTTGECIHKSGGYCDSSCVFAYTPAGEDLCAEPPTPEPSSTPTPSISPKPQTPNDPVPIEKDVENLNQNILPKEAIGKESDSPSSLKDQNIIDIIFKFLTQHLFNLPKFFAQSQSFSKFQTPSETHPKDSSPADILQNSLGRSTGIFGVELPKEIQSENAQQSWQRFKQSIYPKEVLNSGQ